MTYFFVRIDFVLSVRTGYAPSKEEISVIAFSKLTLLTKQRKKPEKMSKLSLLFLLAILPLILTENKDAIKFPGNINMYFMSKAHFMH